jgi:hypothetical protein
MRTPAAGTAGPGITRAGTGIARLTDVLAKTATGVPKMPQMSLESYPIPGLCTSAPKCRFVDLTLWIYHECAEMAHEAGKKA